MKEFEKWFAVYQTLTCLKAANRRDAKEFEKWMEKYIRLNWTYPNWTWDEELAREVWKSALEWVLGKIEQSDELFEVSDFITKELGEE